MSKITLLFLVIAVAIACKKTEDTTPSTTSTSGTATDYSTNVINAFKAYGSSSVSSVTVDGDYVVIKANGTPDHKSPYFKGTSYESSLYVADTRAEYKPAPGNFYITATTTTFKIPKAPKEAASKTKLGTAMIGIALNGVPIGNQYAAGNVELTTSSLYYASFDLYGGHPTPMNTYHYHIEPYYITQKKGSDALVGYLLDGFPVYGPKENGKTITNADLDAYHGHTSKTAEYPNGIYHYHTTAEAPYINGNGYFGTAGTISQ
jgi:YHYH protein